MNRTWRLGLVAAVAAGIVTLDQLSKTWVINNVHTRRHLFWTISLNVQVNNGIAFSQATGNPHLVTAIALAFVAVLVVVTVRSPGWYTAVVLGLVIGGASGNLVDRLFRHNGGAVIDWIDPRFWPVFNVADAAVSVGVVLALAHSLFADGSRAGRDVDQPA